MLCFALSRVSLVLNFFTVFSLHVRLAQKSSYGCSEQPLATNVYLLGRLAVSGVPRPGFRSDRQTNKQTTKTLKNGPGTSSIPALASFVSMGVSFLHFFLSISSSFPGSLGRGQNSNASRFRAQ